MLSISRLVFVFILFSFFSCAKPPAMKEEKAIFVKFDPVAPGELIEEFSTAGELKAAEDVVVSAQRAGKIISINVKEGQYVQAGANLIEIQGKDIDADLIKAQQDFESFEKLYNEGAISQLDLNNYQATLQKLKSYKNDLNIRATVSGQIGEIMVDTGDYVKEGDQLLELIKLYPMELTYTIPERLLSKVKPGQKVILSTDSYPGKEFNAVVKFVSPKVDSQTRATLVRANLDATDLILKANQFVNVRQILDVNKEILLVREEAIYLDQGQEYVFTAEEIEKTDEEKEADAAKAGMPGPPPATHIAKKNRIKVGLRKPGYVQIIEGIQEGDLVIKAGLTSIYDGAKLIQVKEEQAN
jgi:membrane fusion protein, multidrug efflux system